MEAVLDQVDVSEYQRIFDIQQQNKGYVAKSTVSERKAKLKKLKHAVEVKYRDEIRKALFDDFGKHPSEVDLTEIYAVTGEIKHTLSHLKYWMRDKSVATGLAFLGSSSRIKYEPKGVCLLISPWNFPVNLTLCPLISAIAAGNTVIMKPSELTPHTADLMARMISDLFNENEIAVVQGGVETSTELLKLPFNHIFFTGSPEIGKVVMRAAAENLSSVTLELGGKSPTIVDETANVKTAARRIMWGKFLNAGQICIAPDYVYVHERKADEFVEAAKKTLDNFYQTDALNSTDYTKVVNERHHERLVNSLEDAVTKGGNVVYGGKSDKSNCGLEPTLIRDVPMDADLMTKEIFGPILPIRTFSDIEEVLDVINSKEKPLSFYIYSSSNKKVKHILDSTSSGGVCINHNDLHFFNHNLPFGGVNNSGIGNSHGHYGFMEFTNERGIYKQHIPGAIELLMPPYNGFKQFMIDLTIKWF